MLMKLNLKKTSIDVATRDRRKRIFRGQKSDRNQNQKKLNLKKITVEKYLNINGQKIFEKFPPKYNIFLKKPLNIPENSLPKIFQKNF